MSTNNLLPSTSAGGFSSTGNITANVFIGNGSQLTDVTATANTGNIAFSDTTIYVPANVSSQFINISYNGEGYSYFQLPSDATANTTNALLNNQIGNVTIGTGRAGIGTQSWMFGNDGILTVPGEGILQSNNDTIILQSKNTTSGNVHSVRLGINGGLYFATTEYPGGWLDITNNAGNANITSPITSGGAAGHNLNLTAGAADNGVFNANAGGNLNLAGGTGGFGDDGVGGPGGDVNITAGSPGEAGGLAGNVYVNAGTATWTFNNNSQLKVANLTISASNGIGNSASIFEDNGDLQVLASGANGVVNVGWAENALTAGNTSVMWFNEPGNVGNAIIRTGNTADTSYAWAFDNTGNLTIPNDILSNTSIQIDNRLSGNASDIRLYSADDIVLQARDRDAGSTTEGGDINLYAGDSAVDGAVSAGDINIYAGNGGAGNIDVGGPGGIINIETGRGGAATGNSGAIAQAGGDLTILAGGGGDNNGNIDLGAKGGDVFIYSGYSTGNTNSGGNIVLSTGTGGQNGTSGNVLIAIPGYGLNAGGTWRFDATGNLTLPNNTFAVKYANGSPVNISSANTGNILFDQSTIESNQSNAYINLNALGSGVLSLGTTNQTSVRIVTDEGNTNNRWTFDDTGTLTLPGTTSSINYSNGNPMLGNIAFDQSGLITNQSNAYVNLNALGSGILGLGTNDAANVTITTNGSSNASQTWTFDDAGNLTLPSDGYLRVTAGIVGTSPAPTLSGFSSVSANNISTSGNVSAAGNITGANFFGDGSQLTGITATASLIGNLVGNLDANTFSINNLPGLSVAGNITGSFFIGNGSQLTGLPATYSNTDAQTYFASGTSNANISITGNVLTTGRVSATGNITGNVFIGNGSQLTGLPASYSNANAQLYFASGTSNANISITGNILTTADISATGNVSGANFLTIGSVGTGNITGANLITANTFSASGNVFVGAALSVAGNITSNVTYGAFYDTTTQTNSNVGNAIPMSFNTTDINNGVTIAGNANITIAKTGVYNIQFSAQLSKSDTGTDHFYIWLDKNGTAVTESATDVALSGNGARDVAAWNFVVSATAGDYYRLMWMSPDANASIVHVANAAPVPGIPSVILTVVPVGP